MELNKEKFKKWYKAEDPISDKEFEEIFKTSKFSHIPLFKVDYDNGKSDYFLEKYGQYILIPF